MAAAQAQDAATQVTEQAGQAVEAIQSGWSNLSGLVVTYALSVVGALFLLIAGYIGARIVERSVYAAFRRIPGFEETLALFFSKVARYVVLIMIIVMVLGQFGIQTASIIAALGAIGLAVGLALQGTLQNIAAGIMLLALRPFKVGEFIEVCSPHVCGPWTAYFCLPQTAVFGMNRCATLAATTPAAWMSHCRLPMRPTSNLLWKPFAMSLPPRNLS
jgi:hypothetical protein